MYNLQEAYLGVYYDLDEKYERMDIGKIHRQADKLGGVRGEALRIIARTFNRPDYRIASTRAARQNRTSPPSGPYRQNKARQAMRDAQADIKKYGLHEQLDLYDLIFDYLLDEGYADTEEAATVIMANMSEDWIDDICGEVLDEEVLGARKGTIRSVIGKGGKSIKYVQSGGNIVSGDRAAQERADAADRRRSGRNRVNAAQAEQARKKSIETMNSDPNESPDRHTITRHHKGRKDSVDLGVEYYHDEVPTDYRARRRRASGR